MARETISFSITEGLREEIEQVVEEEYDGNRSEAIRELLQQGLEYERLQIKLESREERIETLEEQLARRSQVEDRVEELAIEVREQQEEVDPPWPVRWYRWVRS